MRSQNVDAGAAPAVFAYKAVSWRSILQTDDLLVILNYQLPIQTTPAPTPVAGIEAWCGDLLNPTGCDANPVVPAEPTSLLDGTAYETLCDLSGGSGGCLNGTGTILGQDRIHRVWYSIVGLYFLPGHGIAWADPDINMCVEPNPATFSPSVSACVPVIPNTAANTQIAQRAQLASDLQGLLIDVEHERSLGPGSLVSSSGKITSAGRTLAVEAFGPMPSVIPFAFQAAGESAVQTPFTLTSTPSLLQQHLIATATALAWGDFEGGGQSLLGIGGTFYATMLFMGLGLVVGGIIAAVVQGDGRLPLAVMAFGTMSLIGVFVNGPTPSVIAVSLVCLAFPAGWFILRRAPG